MPEADPERTPRRVAVDCYVRTDAISDPVEDRIEAVIELERTGVVDELSVRTWPAEVVLTPLTAETLAVERYRTFAEWAAQWGAEVEPPFRRVTRDSGMTGETREVLRTPALCLAVQIDGRLREVFPHTSKGITYSVADAVAALSEGVLTLDDTVTADPGSTESPRFRVSRGDDRCPECDGPLATGQGLYSCFDCDWVGVASGRGTLLGYGLPDRPERGRDVAADSAPSP